MLGDLILFKFKEICKSIEYMCTLPTVKQVNVF